jgi:ATP-dependent Clp protease protease subunit
MSKPEVKYRKILLSENITSSSVKDVIKEIMEINNDDDLKEADYKDWERKPIKLFINSFGGSVYDGLSLVDIIKQSKTPVHTISIGSSMSMGLWIYLTGHKRFVGENATLMFHDISTVVWDKTQGIKQEVKEMERLQAILSQHITCTSLVKQETLDDLEEFFNNKKD